MARPTLGHLDPQFLAVMDDIADHLRVVFGTENRMTFPVSGTGSAAMEAAMVNVIEPGDKIIVGGQRRVRRPSGRNGPAHGRYGH